tara:strand:- start:164 stop:1129 length:966 start_codon:yes stop_codon:yes gene_type:complete
MKRPQNMSLCDYIEWVMNHELEYEPNDWETDCWIPRKDRSRIKGNRVNAYWKGKMVLMYQLTYMAWHGIETNPFSQKLHASHTCNNPECINPLHIILEDAPANENRKLQHPAVGLYKESQRKKQLELHKNGKILPQGLTHKEKAKWFLENKTWLDTNSELVNGSHCMRWTGGADQKGYGRTNITISQGRKKKVEMHRYIHCMMNDLPYGEDPDDEWNAKGKGFKVADHICNQQNCVNPDHIQLISRSENSTRAENKARKITEETARRIIEDFLSVKEWPRGSKAEFARKWAKELNLSVDIAYNIVFRKIRWKPLLIEYGLL